MVDIQIESSLAPESKLRCLTCDQNLLSRSDGSALFNHGDTSVLASVYGPAEVKMNKEILDRATVDVVYKPKIGLPGCNEKLQERQTRNTCEKAIIASLHPRTSISLIVQEMQNSGSLLSCCVNACCMALLDAGTPLNFMVAAVTCILDEKDNIILDPKLKYEQEASASMTFVFSSGSSNLLTVSTKGSYTNEKFQECLLACQLASEDIFRFYRDSMKKKILSAK